MKVETQFELKSSNVAVFGIKEQWLVGFDSRESYPKGFMLSGEEFSKIITEEMFGSKMVICDDGIFLKCVHEGRKFSIYFMPVSWQMAHEHAVSYVEIQMDLGMYPTVAFNYEYHEEPIPTDDIEVAYLDCKSPNATIEELFNYIMGK